MYGAQNSRSWPPDHHTVAKIKVGFDHGELHLRCTVLRTVIVKFFSRDIDVYPRIVGNPGQSSFDYTETAAKRIQKYYSLFKKYIKVYTATKRCHTKGATKSPPMLSAGRVCLRAG